MLRTQHYFLTICLSFILFAIHTPSFAATGDDALAAAHRAFVARDAATIESLSGKTKDHLLGIYVRFWKVALRLENENPDEIIAFLDENAGTPLADELRGKWLAELAKKGQWSLFGEQFPKLINKNPDILCYSLQERMLRQGLDNRIIAGIKSVWQEDKPLADGCIPVVSALIQSGGLSSGDIRARVRRLVLANLVSEAVRTRNLYPGTDLPEGKQIEEACRYPARFLTTIDEKTIRTDRERELVFMALASLAREDLSKAVELLAGRFQAVLFLPDQQRLWAGFALRGARLHKPEAMEWFRKGQSLTAEELAWKARLALRSGDWQEVKKTIEAMPASLQRESTWQYWQGRALCATGETPKGKALLAGISERHDFYGILAAEELGMPPHIPTAGAPPTREELAQVAGLPGIARALALYRLDLPGYAAREWRWSVKLMTDRQLLAASELARQNGIWDRAVFTAEMTSTEHNFSLRYPSPYRDIILKHARDCQLDEAVVLGLVRQESLFNSEARSTAGAIGLMQLMPETARIVARQTGLGNFKTAKLTKPEINTRLGTSYLRQVLERFSSNYALAAAAYNAGPHRAQRWKNSTELEGAIYVESIPFTETRNYVKKVLANSIYYAALSGGACRSLKDLLGKIDGRQDKATQP